MLRLVDGNNVFKRYFHTMGASSLQSMYLDSISQYPQLTTIMWVWDGKNSNKRRKDIYPDYKGNRTPRPDEFYQTRDLFKELLTHSNCLTLEVPEWEADDVINKLALGSADTVEIVSTDQDFHSIEREGLTLVTEFPAKVEKRFMKMYKTLVGDSSDNIPGLKGFGKGTWAKMTESQIDLLQRFIEQTDVLWSDEIAEHIGFKPAMQKNFLASADQLRDFFKIVSFFDVPDELIGKHLKQGQLNQDKAFDLLAELFLV